MRPAGADERESSIPVDALKTTGAWVRSFPFTLKLLVTILGLALVPLLLVTFVSQNSARDILLENKRQDLSTHAADAVANLDSIMEVRRSQIGSIARGPIVSAYAADPSSAMRQGALLDAFLSMMSAHDEIRSLAVIDPATGATTVSTVGSGGQFFGQRESIRAAAAGELAISAPSLDDGQNVIYYAAPVRNDAGQVIQVAVMSVSADELWAPLSAAAARLGSGSFVVLTDEHGVRVAHSQEASLVHQSWVSLTAEKEAALVNGQTYGADVREIGSTDLPEIAAVLGATHPTANITEHRLAASDETYESGLARSRVTGWTLIESVPHSAFMAPVEWLRFWNLVIVGVAVIIITILTLLVSRVALKPVRELLGSVERMHEGDMETPVPDIPDREMGMLARRFNSLREKVRSSYEALQQGYIGLARALVASLEARDVYTAGHTERVSHYSLALARHMGLNKGEMAKVRRAAELHDIGKTCVPDMVLLKPDRLSMEEFAEIQRHPVKSADIIGHLEFLRDVVPLVEGHHERIDGGGYPRGLRGNDIPLGARIIAVADAFDAMTSHRAYRRALSRDKAATILREGAGSQWDADVVNAFLEIIAEKDVDDTGAASEELAFN